MVIANQVLKAIDALLNFIVVVSLCLIMAFASYALWDNSMIYKSVDDVQASILQYKPEVSDPQMTFAELLKINPDVRAWLTLDGTNIDYPVVQGKTNLTYINTDIFGEFALAGSIFLDSRNDGLLKDDYSLLYGHDMDEGKMFGDLSLYKKEAFFKENKTGTLMTPEQTYDLKIFATLLVPSSEERIFNTSVWQDNSADLIEYAKSNALHLNEQVIEASQKLDDKLPNVIAFTTCSSEFTQARTVVLAFIEPISDTQ